MVSARSAEYINNAAYYPAFGAVRLGGNAGKNQQTVTGSNPTFQNLLDEMKISSPAGNSPYGFCQDMKCVLVTVQTYDEVGLSLNLILFPLKINFTLPFTFNPY